MLILNATKLGTLFTTTLCHLKEYLMRLKRRWVVRRHLKARDYQQDDSSSLLDPMVAPLDAEAQFRMLSDKLAQLVKSGKQVRVRQPESMMPTWVAWFVVPSYLLAMALVFFLIEPWTFFDS